MPESNSSPRKPWPMRWTILAIAGFIVIYTLVTVFFRKENAAHNPYEEARIRGGYELREVGWDPFPNAFGMSPDAVGLARLPIGEGEFLALEEVPFEVLDRQDERVAKWSDRIPPLEQGEQLQRVEASVVVQPGKPYIARLFWDAPEDFVAPQLVVFRSGNQILIVPRAPERSAEGSREETIFLIPPEFVEPGEYEVFLSTEGAVNRWTFRAE